MFYYVSSAFATVPAVMATFPWSLISTLLTNPLLIAWDEKFPGHGVVGGCLFMLTLLPDALLNAIILYFIGKLIERITGRLSIVVKDLYNKKEK